VAWIEVYTADVAASPSREVSLVTVDKMDAVVTKFRGDSPLVKQADEEQFEVAGVSVFTNVHNLPGYGMRTNARWGLANGIRYTARVPSDRQTSRAVVEQLVLRSLTPNAAKNTSATRVNEIARWIEDESYVGYLFGAPVVQTDSSGVTRVVLPPGAESFTTTRSDIPEEVLQRVRTVLMPWTRQYVRSGAFIVAGNVTKDKLRPVRRSELHRLIKQVDRARATEIATPHWRRIAKDLEYSDTFGAICVRSETDVSCAHYLLNRLVGKTWVYASILPNGGDVLTNGRVLRAASSSTSRYTVYVLPPQTERIQSTFRQPDLTTLTRTVERPAF
jgi:hypothetical protein